MKILLCSMEFETLTGQPIYNYNLAKGLTELGHEVTCVGFRTGGVIKKWLEDIGVRVYDFIDKDKWFGIYNLVIISENHPEFLDNVVCNKSYNFCHSKGEPDKPIEHKEIVDYLFPREQVRDHWRKEGEIMPIPIDLKKWQVKREKQEKYTILAPCTIDTLRTKFLLRLMERANKDTNIWIVGKDHGGLRGVKIPKYVTLFPETKNIIDYMKKADEVASIFYGTIIFEAWAMGLKTSVYDEEGNYKLVPIGNIEEHDYLRIAERFLTLI